MKNNLILLLTLNFISISLIWFVLAAYDLLLNGNQFPLAFYIVFRIFVALWVITLVSATSKVFRNKNKLYTIRVNLYQVFNPENINLQTTLSTTEFAGYLSSVSDWLLEQQRINPEGWEDTKSCEDWLDEMKSFFL